MEQNFLELVNKQVEELKAIADSQKNSIIIITTTDLGNEKLDFSTWIFGNHDALASSMAAFIKSADGKEITKDAIKIVMHEFLSK